LDSAFNNLYDKDTSKPFVSIFGVEKPKVTPVVKFSLTKIVPAHRNLENMK